jgi:hypothetical protein
MTSRYFRYKLLKTKRRKRNLVKQPPYSHCKNCGNQLHGQYCSVCGQFALVTNQPLKESILSYLDTNYAFDQRLATTLYFLFLKPGKLTREFINGRIARYVHPFKLYFFASILFFGIALGFNNSDKAQEKIDQNMIMRDADLSATKDSKMKTDSVSTSVVDNYSLSIGSENPATEKWIRKVVEQKIVGKTKGELMQMFYRNLSFAMLLLMPIFAILLKLFYRRQKQFYFIHLIHAIHLHATFFIFMSISTLWDEFVGTPEVSGWMFLLTLVYLVLSLSNLYGQGIMKSILKAILMMWVYMFVLLIAVAGAAVFIILV